jgi:CRP-like cAMP-binding protein
LIMPELKPLKLLKGDILYQERDHAEELYFIKQGKIKLHVDIKYFINERLEEESESENADDELNGPKNIAFIAYVEGSHFGDVDIFGKDRFYTRDSTAIATCESHFFVLTKEAILNIKRTNYKEIDEMEKLAKKR